MTMHPDLEYPDIPLKQYPKKFQNLFSFQTCQVAVNFWIYDKRKRIVVHSGSSRACGCNHHKTSIHAEQRAIEYLRKHKKNKNLQVYIWRWSKCGEIKSTYCCTSCSQLVHKYKYENDVFTFNNGKRVNAIIENPELSLAYKIKYDLSH
jgi:tRNA(Arg) A34 adenosine deaminase TadA